MKEIVVKYRDRISPFVFSLPVTILFDSDPFLWVKCEELLLDHFVSDSEVVEIVHEGDKEVNLDVFHPVLKEYVRTFLRPCPDWVLQEFLDVFTEKES